jgi:hypothetical protein
MHPLLLEGLFGKFSLPLSIIADPVFCINWKEINNSKQYRFTGRKIDDPELLEAIRLTIISNMIEYHPVHILISSYLM